MDKNLRPGILAMMIGGLVLLIGVFLPWISIDTPFGDVTESGFSTDGGPGFLGIFAFLIALAVGGVVALKTFANVALPDQVLGFSWNQIWLMLSLSATLITVGRLLGAEGTGIGLVLSAIASIAMLVGAFLETKAGAATTTSSAPPTAF
jgi:hypothetical protein